MAPGEADLTAILNAPENETPEQKLDALKTKFLQKASAHKKALAEHKQRNDDLFKEKSALVNDYAKVTAVKD